MSLKYFHIVFITFSWIVAFGFAVWCFLSPDAEGIGFKIGGVGSAVAGIALVWYEISFIAKMRRLHLE